MNILAKFLPWFFGKRVSPETLSSVVRKYARETRTPLITVRLSKAPTGDILGMPRTIKR
jgi:hypothetical protein